MLSQTYCDPSLFCGILVIDGKYVKVKGHKQKIPFIYGIDYLTHDIPVGFLALSESTDTFKKFFRLLKEMNYPLRVVICDDTYPIKLGLKEFYPNIGVQMCHTHYLENIRQKLHIRTEEEHQHFFNSLCKHIFEGHRLNEQFNKYFRYHILNNRTNKHPLRTKIILDIFARQKELFTYTSIDDCPKDTNLIELYNSHLQARLSSVKGFQTFESAQRWLNAYLIRRRTKPFTDCSTKFKHLNGKCSLEMTLKKEAHWPNFISQKAPKMKR